MIEKIIKIENVGKFRAFNAQRDVTLKKVTVLFGENAIGKSTITSILWSLKENKPEIVIGRKTIDTVGQIRIDIKIGSAIHSFNSSSWNSFYENIEIFDKKFIRENLYADFYVDSNHKQQFIELALGAESVSVSNRIKEIDILVRDLNPRIRDLKEGIIRSSELQEYEFDNFLVLEELDDIDTKIEEQAQKIERIKKTDEIRTHEKLRIIDLPEFKKDELQTFLNKSLSNISTTAIENVREHIQDCLDEKAGERWLDYGVRHIKGDTCPFCTQSLENVTFIEHLKNYFDDAYKGFCSEIETEASRISGIITPELSLRIREILLFNVSQWNFWKGFFDNTQTYSDLESIDYSSIIADLHSAVLRITAEKLNKPLEKHQTPESADLHIDEYTRLSQSIEKTNVSVGLVNEEIEKIKQQVVDQNLSVEEQRFKKLKKTKKRFTESICAQVELYQRTIEAKENLTQEKEEKKQRLREIAGNEIAQYKNRINYFLSNFGADFRIETSSPNFSGGRPNIDYTLVINNRSIPLGKSNTNEALPCFKNTLSEGDKNSLALAFFLSKVEKDTLIQSKTIVFDDPVNSLDEHRMNATCDKIIQFADTSGQTIILTHNIHFLRKVFDKSKHLETKYIRIGFEGFSSRLFEFDVAEKLKGPYFNNYKTVFNYANNSTGDEIRVSKTLRILLEANFRIRFPNEFPQNKWLGEFIEIINEADQNSILHSLKNSSDFFEIKEINDYSKQFHHDQNPDFESVIISPTELKTYCRRTIELITK
jgi:wobble nucleotide-excising tRNase